MYYEAFMANDGYIYEREFIENLSNGKQVINSPTTGKSMIVGGISCVNFNIKLEEFYNEHPELLELRYVSNNTIVKQFRTMVQNKDSEIEDIISHVEKHKGNKECKFEIFKNDKKIHDIYNHEKGLMFIVNDIIIYKSITNKMYDIITYSKICVLAYDYFDHSNHAIFYQACYCGRYELVIKLYNNNNNLINYIHTNKIDNIFNAGAKGNNLDILKFLHEKNPLLYKNLNSDGYSTFTYCIAFKQFEIAKWLYSIDNTQINHKYNKYSIFEYAVKNKQMELIEFLFSLDKNIFSNDPKKKEILEEIKETWFYNKCAKLLQLIAENA